MGLQLCLVPPLQAIPASSAALVPWHPSLVRLAWAVALEAVRQDAVAVVHQEAGVGMDPEVLLAQILDQEADTSLAAVHRTHLEDRQEEILQGQGHQDLEVGNRLWRNPDCALEEEGN